MIVNVCGGRMITLMSITTLYLSRPKSLSLSTSPLRPYLKRAMDPALESHCSNRIKRQVFISL